VGRAAALMVSARLCRVDVKPPCTVPRWAASDASAVLNGLKNAVSDCNGMLRLWLLGSELSSGSHGKNKSDVLCGRIGEIALFSRAVE